MPLTEKGSEIKKAIENQYGEKKGESVFYASKNKGTISGVDGAADCDAAERVRGIPGVPKLGIARQTRVK